MPLNSIQCHVQELLDGLAVPGFTNPVQAYTTPPVYENITGPRAYVWGGRMRGRRQTAPRGIAPNAGFKRLDWVVDVYLVGMTLPDAPGEAQLFPLFVDAVMAATWTAPMPVFITDPTTQLETQLLQIGEEFELDYPPERAIANGRTLWYSCRLGLNVYEAVQG